MARADNRLDVLGLKRAAGVLDIYCVRARCARRGGTRDGYYHRTQQRRTIFLRLAGRCIAPPRTRILAADLGLRRVFIAGRAVAPYL